MQQIAHFAYGIAQTGFGQFGMALLLSVVFQGFADRTLNLSRMTGFVHCMIFTLIYPAVIGLTGLVFTKFGKGLIPLPIHSGWIIAGFLLYLLVYDLLVYLLHRTQHAVPFLWAMHSMHHAEMRVTAMTAYVNYWGEALIENAAVYPVIYVLFKVPVMFIFAGAWVRYLSTLVVHAEVKLHLGPLGWFVVGPQYHRLHHSSDPAHYNANFTGMFPLWDWLFGTLILPGRDQFPTVGLEPPEVAASGFETLWWPWRKHLATLVTPAE